MKVKDLLSKCANDDCLFSVISINKNHYTVNHGLKEYHCHLVLSDGSHGQTLKEYGDYQLISFYVCQGGKCLELEVKSKED